MRKSNMQKNRKNKLVRKAKNSSPILVAVMQDASKATMGVPANWAESAWLRGTRAV